MKSALWLPALALFACFSAAAGDAPLSPPKAPAYAAAYIIEPADGAVVTNPVTVVFGLKGMGVAPAGMEHADTGHFHLLVDTGLPPQGAPIPKDEQHLHFGGGQTQTVLTLKPGKHTLQLLMGDFAHMSFDPPVISKLITITVK
ncbi:MAG TPA: DUF4399 domain-containing protein [Gammaproteobacteria bacterium]|jgi:hypothetical protein|nr:DUF4399 domain-containing protein [Gammaproteobacteria bacterium]